MIKIVTEKPSALDGTAFYRSVGPLTELRKKYSSEIQVDFVENLTWCDVQSADILFLLRPCLNKHVELISSAKNWGVKVWIDFDDNLFEVPDDNPSHSFYNSPDIRKNLLSVIENADLVTVSTGCLAELVYRSNKNYLVIPNAVHEKVFDWLSNTKKEKTGLTVLWRGTNTHMRDLLEVREPIQKLMQEFRDVTWIALGAKPWFLDSDEQKLVHIPSADLVTYFKCLDALSPDLVVVPLARSAFNQSKSNIAMLEASLVGAASLVPNWPEWWIPGSYQYEFGGFENALRKAIDEGKGQMRERAKMTFDYFCGQRSLKLMNEKRIEAIRGLMEVK